MTPSLKAAGPPLQPDALDALAAAAGVALPGEYRAFLLARGGGWPTPDEIVVPSDDEPEGGRRTVNFLLSAGDAFRRREQLTQGAGLGGGMLPVALCEDGDIILLCVAGGDAGCVYYWVNVEGDYPMALGDGQVRRVADTWDEFMSLFVSD